MSYVRSREGEVFPTTKRGDTFDASSTKIGVVTLIAKADTIEEICDYIIVKRKNYNLPSVVAVKDVLDNAKRANIDLKEHFRLLFKMQKDIEYVKLGILVLEDNQIKIVAEYDEEGKANLI